MRGSGCFETWQDVAAYRDTCHWTDWSPHTCVKEMMTVSRLCWVTDCHDDLADLRQTDRQKKPLVKDTDKLISR